MGLSFAEIAEENVLHAKRKGGFHKMRPERARALSRRGTRTVVGLANDYAHTYALHSGSSEGSRSQLSPGREVAHARANSGSACWSMESSEREKPSGAPLGFDG